MFRPAGTGELWRATHVIDELEMALCARRLVNTLSYPRMGAEVDAEYHITHNLSVRGGWTYTDAVVQHSFASNALSPSINPALPQYSYRSILTPGGRAAIPHRAQHRLLCGGLDCRALLRTDDRNHGLAA